jgi:two-component system, LytTR family, response regulator
MIAASDDADVFVRGECQRVRQSLGRLQLRLPAGQFLRVNRSTVVSVERIKELELRTHGDCTFVLTSGQRLLVTRRYRAGMEQLPDRRA